jgi:hypothetical protein
MNADLTRRTLLAVLACALAAPSVALAQDPRASEAQRAARDWLALADKFDASGTWKAAGSRFQQSIPQERWAALLKREREARGTVVQRTTVATSFPSELPSLPAGGNYATIHFRTAFANEPNGSEDLTLEQGPGSAWRVIGYVIR